jgi:glycosyltransferase involved in cell wall biosynthesis
VTTEYPGITPSGGIGAYTKIMADLLYRNHKVCIFVANSQVDLSRMSVPTSKDITFFSMFDCRSRPMTGGSGPMYTQSIAIYDWLKTKEFDLVNFPDWSGLGTASIQAKKAQIAFASTDLTITLHGPTSWAQEANQRQSNLDWFTDETSSYLEFESIFEADRVFAPSSYILGWVEAKAGKSIENSKVIINPYLSTEIKVEEKKSKIHRKEIIFFGRMEPRKGVDLFMNALKVHDDLLNCQITFLGRNVMGDRLRQQYGHLEWFNDIQIIENMSTSEALSYVKNSGGIVVVPSLSENCPYAIQELANLGIPLIASKVGGIPELIRDENLFEPDPLKLAEIFIDYLSNNVIPAIGEPLNNSNEVNKEWIDEFNLKFSTKKTYVIKEKIGVIVPHYNQSNWLMDSLNSIKNQNYLNFECIVIDDGSDVQHKLEFWNISKNFEDDERFKFFEQENSDVGFTRNRGASLTSANNLIFHDADDIMGENCLSYVLKAFDGGAKIVTSHFSTIDENHIGSTIKSEHIVDSYEPFGGAIRLLWRRNVVGGANLAIKRETFDQLGKWNGKRGSNHQDWRLLTRAVINGVPVAVIPERLLGYRGVSNSMTQTRNHLSGQTDVISEYNEMSPLSSHQLLIDIMRWVVTSEEQEVLHRFQSSTERIVRKVQKIGLRLVPYGSRRWNWLLPVYRKMAKG